MSRSRLLRHVPSLATALATVLATATVLLAPTTGEPTDVAPTAYVLVTWPAAADTDGDGLDDLVDGCPTVASGNPTGCPSAWRKVSLRWLEGPHRLQAHVTSPVAACAARTRIKLFLDRAGRADRLLSSDASFRGRRRFAVPRGARYYVMVSPSYSSGVAECGRAVSRTVRIPRR